jgi:hypothetical protein
MQSIQDFMKHEKYGFIKKTSKDFINNFDNIMSELGYTSNGNIGNGFCWGKYMIIYTKSGVKSQKSYARIYIQENGSLCLRIYLSNVDKHKEAIESTPEFIQKTFTNGFGACKHCHNQKEDETCSHRKSYTIADTTYEKCDGFTFYFTNPDTSGIPEYLKLITTFYPERKRK